MRPLQYMDTARLGQMTSAAKDAQLDFVRLSAEEPSSLYFEEFLRHGFNAWPSSYQNRFPGLHTWNGVAGLKQSIRQIAGAPNDRQVLLASRSISLVQLATSCMFRVCRHVLTTDLSWPTYQGVLESTAKATHNRVTVVPLRDAVLKHHWNANDICQYLADKFAVYGCDSLFLPAVDHLGIRLPVRDIVAAIDDRSECRFCMIDAAQAIGHVPLADCIACADFIVAGTHKWLGAYLPLGIGFFGRPRSRDLLGHMAASSRVHDPLNTFCEQLDAGLLNGGSETVNLAPLLTCAGALSDRLSQPHLDSPSEIRRTLMTIQTPDCGEWNSVQVDESLQSQIILLQSACHSKSADETRRLWLEAGVIVTGYDGGLARLSWSPRIVPRSSTP